MRPSFLIIGGMKCGSTTLYRDLLTHPRIFMPDDKEPNSLCDDAVLRPDGAAAYERLFARASCDQLCGEASTRYTKLPDDEGVPRRALEVLGPDLKLIYIVREPAARVRSHHHHAIFAADFDTRDVNEALDRHPQLIDWTRYAMQAGAWIDVFGREQVRIVQFEEYIQHRSETVGELCAFLGLDPRPELVDAEQVFNQSQSKPVATRRWKKIIHNPAYRKVVRPLLSGGMRDRLRGALLPKAREELPEMTGDTIDAVYDRLADDLETLRRLMGRAEPVWDRAAARQKGRPA